MLNRNGQRGMPAVYEALGSSLDVKVALDGGFENVLRLVGADYGAVALAGHDAVPDWVVQKHLPPAFLGAYVEMIEHDFLLTETLKQPNVVLRDQQMSTRRDFDRNPFVLRAGEVGAPIHQVMAVSLIIADVGMCGLALYRDRARPFAKREQRMLQQLTPAFANTVRNCRLFGASERRSRLLDTLLEDHRRGVVFLKPPAREVERTPAATALLDAWFGPAGRSGGGLPQVLLDVLDRAVAAWTKGVVGPWFWKRDGQAADLMVEIHQFPEPDGGRSWALMLRERSHGPSVPAAWNKRLTKREREVVAKVILGWENRLIAGDLDCSTRTVEKHVESILDKLGAPDRKALMLRAKDETDET